MNIHTFVPTRYFTTMGAHAPVLRIQSGDTVRTTCVDARGFDGHDQKVTPSGNPMTGPFFVEGAEPGDTLAVRLEQIRPSRRRGWSGVLLAPNVVDPEDVAKLAKVAVHDAWDWDVDLEANVARLNQPSSPWHGRALGLDPMLGCFGVAAERGQFISTATSGTHGGNMDYRGFRAGSTAYFPVFEPGALFFLGDGHALQGDGEIAGTGIEISMDVQFRVSVLKHKSHWPRGEDAAFVFTLGNARPLDQCVQHATSEMLRWLTEEHGFDLRHASLLLGQAVRYDLGNVFDPAYTMVCKLSKALLADFSGQSNS